MQSSRISTFELFKVGIVLVPRGSLNPLARVELKVASSLLISFLLNCVWNSALVVSVLKKGLRLVTRV